jgi:hypothetical protein
MEELPFMATENIIMKLVSLGVSYVYSQNLLFLVRAV